MDLTLASLLAEARLTLKSPREGVRRMIAMNLPMQARWLALCLMAIASTILTYLSFELVPAEQREPFGIMMTAPIRMAVLQLVLLVVLANLVYWVGRARGGTGSFADTLVVLAWLQFLMLCLQAVQLVLQVVLPPVAVLLSFASLALFLWLLTNFVAELHGFQSLGRTLAGILAVVLIMVFGISFIIAAAAAGSIG